MIKFISNHPLSVFILPSASVAVFVIVFNNSSGLYRLDEMLGKISSPSDLSTQAGFLLALLSSCLVIGTVMAAVLVTILNANFIRDRAQLRRFVLGSLIVSVGFITYNIIGYFEGKTRFIFFTLGIFELYSFIPNRSSWEGAGITPQYIHAVYLVPFAAMIASATFLCGSCSYLCRNQPPGPRGDSKGSSRNEIARVLRRKVSLFRISLNTSSVLFSSAIVFIFSWQNVTRVSINNQVLAEKFGDFMFSFSLYWAIAYSIIGVLVFAPIGLVINHTIDETLHELSNGNDKTYSQIMSEYSITKIVVSEYTQLISALLPVATALITNALSIGLVAQGVPG